MKYESYEAVRADEHLSSFKFVSAGHNGNIVKIAIIEVTFTVNENMRPAKPVGAIARKIAEANEHLSKIKNLDEILKRYSSPE